jgi:hypothetical protein
VSGDTLVPATIATSTVARFLARFGCQLVAAAARISFQAPICRLQALAVTSRTVLAMQKVEGSSPFIRFSERWKRPVFS